MEEYPNFYLYKRIVQAKLFIDENFNEPINLDEISDEACFSKFHFIRLFRKIYEKTPHQYLSYVRIENSKILLQQSLSVTQTCFDVGFESVNSFIILFKNHTGSTPSKFQADFFKRAEQIKKIPLRFIPNCFITGNSWN